MTMLSDTKLVVLDVETTGLSPAMGDRIVEIGMIACRGATEISRTSHLINPGRAIPWDVRQVHGISDQDVSECPPFKEIAEEVKSTLVGSWTVGHNVRLGIGFMVMENGDGQTSDRTIHPVARFRAGRYTYIRAHCRQAEQVRRFRVDRFVLP